MRNSPNPMPGSRRVPIADIFLPLLAFALACLNTIRILRVPITVDEAPSRSDLLLGYLDYVRLSKVTANIHILNSILRKAAIDLFGNSPFSLRLPNLLAHVLFLTVTVRLCQRLFTRTGWQIAAFLVLNLNPFLFEFFGYSRGYGLGTAFMVTAIYFLVRFVQTGRQLDPVWALLAASAAVWSNFSLLNFYLALCGVFFLHGALSLPNRSVLLRTVIPALVISTLLAALIAGPIQKLQASGELYYGGEIDLIRDTITSLARMSIHNPFPDDTAVQAIVWAFCAMHLASLIFYAIGFRRLRQDALFRTGSYLCILINIVFLSIIVQHHLLGTKYLIDRTALFIIPLSSLNILYALAIAARSKPLIATVIFWSFAVLHVYNFGTKTSLQKSYVWWLDNYNETVIERLATKARGMQRPLRLRVCWILMPSMDYYVYTRYPTLFEPLEYSRDPPDDTSQQAYDYLYFPADDLKQVSPAFIADTSFEENRILYRRR